MQNQPLTPILRFILFSITTLALLHDAAAAVGGAYQQNSEGNGFVSIEAEHYDNHVIQGGHSWMAEAPSGSSGSGAMEASPNNGTNNNTDYVSRSPRLDFRVSFARTGIHHVWVRAHAASGRDDSVHVGVDGAAIPSSDRISRFALGSWSWSKRTMDGPVATINISSPGVHTLNLWMREDGIVVDKLLLTTNADYIPSGAGVPESPRDDPEQVNDVLAPSVPTGLSGNAVDASRIDISWSASTDAGGSGLSGYRVYRDGVEIATTTTPNYSDTGLSAVTLYTYTIQAYDNAGNVSVQSAPVSVTTASPETDPQDPEPVNDNQAPSMPAGLSGTAVDASRIDLNWSASVDAGGSGLSGYRIYRNGVKIGTATVPNYSDTGLAPETSYTYLVEAYDNAGNVSVRSNSVTALTKASGTGGTTVGSAMLSWIPPTTHVDGTALTDLAGYKIYYGSSPDSYSSTIDVASPGLSSYVIGNLSPGTYYFSVTAYDGAGIESAFSNQASKVIN